MMSKGLNRVCVAQSTRVRLVSNDESSIGNFFVGAQIVVVAIQAWLLKQENKFS